MSKPKKPKAAPAASSDDGAPALDTLQGVSTVDDAGAAATAHVAAKKRPRATMPENAASSALPASSSKARATWQNAQSLYNADNEAAVLLQVRASQPGMADAAIDQAVRGCAQTRQFASRAF